jgi:hypothetical protein
MSDFGGIVLAGLALPLLAVVLLVAGVCYLAIRGANLAANALLEGINFASQPLASSVKSASNVLAQAGELDSTGLKKKISLPPPVLDTKGIALRLRETARDLYQESLSEARQLRDLAEKVATAGPAAGPITLKATTESWRAEDLLARARAASGALESELPLKLVAEKWSQPQLDKAKANLETAKLRLASGQLKEAAQHAAEAEALFTTTLHDAHQRLLNAEKTTIAVQAGNALVDLGYEVKIARVKRNVALVGRRGQQVMAMVLQPDSRIQLDMAGFEGSACERDTMRLLAKLRENGLVVAEVNLIRHGRFTGGPWIHKAQRQGKPLEVAMAELLDPVAQAGTSKGSPPVRRSSSLSVGALEQERLTKGRALLWNSRVREATR